ncbi:uncharacterized protein sS8_4746 [Methylocaldum marinum]|uniref:Uncharacterized protein n=1 Tax=Methylocaldum marinum TaxID=1432792 RepID=A0A250KYF9_9GAMM|nr:hypothetical protein [Methylocaldum marinum]BBA36670.1 uncharacterized protein sS8_4746 [Methylocaldum marinum]
MLIFLKCLVAVSILIFIVGLIKPKWILFWMKQPDRLTATSLGLLLFMASWTGIAKLTLKPKPPEHARPSERSVDDQNTLQLDRR